MKIHTLAAMLALAISGGAQAATATFDDLSLAPNSHFFPEVTTTFSSGGATFNHSYTEYFPGCCHTDWIYSNETDTTTADYTNQFSAVAGSGAQGSSNYAIANLGAPSVGYAGPVTATGAYFTNSTYAALSMLNGDSFAKKFGGASGNDADWFKLTILAQAAGGITTGAVDVYLADYRFADNSLDYVMSDWTYVDLSALSTLGAFNSLHFALSSSDNGDFGMNTPAYFAMDSLAVTAVPEPGHAALFLSGLALLGVVARRRRST